MVVPERSPLTPQIPEIPIRCETSYFRYLVVGIKVRKTEWKTTRSHSVSRHSDFKRAEKKKAKEIAVSYWKAPKMATRRKNEKNFYPEEIGQLSRNDDKSSLQILNILKYTLGVLQTAAPSACATVHHHLVMT
ncbi:hypothetical protein RUM43_002060 [Polyplax serrata]|uniref:Uncharacterized protein n=1 Tax=Polyplax serrata TaxID=468196 RepID=A0AAN8PZ42_POLSC